jgi:hypothetical protein
VIFALNVPLVLVCLWLIRRAVAECPGEGRQRIDVPGTLLCVLGLAGPTWALIQGPQLGWSNPHVWIPMFGGIGALIAFLAYERIAPYPMLAPAIFRSRNFAVGNAVTFATYAGLGAGTFYVALFLQQIAGYGALEAGLTLTPITLLLISLSRGFGALAARVGPRLLVTTGPIVGGLGLLTFARVDGRADYLTDVLPATLLFGLGLAMTVAPLTATVLDAADRRHAGIASGVNNAVARVASLLAIAGVGAVLTAQFGAQIDKRLGDAGNEAARAYTREARKHPLTLPRRAATAQTRAAVREANVEGFRTAMVVAGLLMIAGGLLAVIGIENPRREP